ncbi:MAG: TrkH family potassium uptake protein [Flavobacteriaceae bacterium]
MLPVFFLFAHFLGVMSLAYVLPALAAIIAGETALAPPFILTGTLGVFVAGAFIFALRGHEQRLKAHQRYLLAFLLFALLPAFGCIPIMLAIPGTSAIDAYFEAVSALTTTGSTLLPRYEQLPDTIIFWRCLMEWIGGGLTLLVAVLVLGPAGVGGLPPSDARIIEHGGENERHRLNDTLGELLPLYFSLTFACFACLLVVGAPAFDALCLAFSALSTGGFVGRGGDFTTYLPMAGTWIYALFMLVGASSILWLRSLTQGRWHRIRDYREFYWLAGITAAVGVWIAAILYEASGGGLWVAMTDGFATAASLVSTTAVESRHGSFALLPFVAVIMILLVGGSGFSTAGGLKLFRVGAMSVQAYRELNRLVYPHGVRRARFGSQTYDMQMMKAIWSAMTATLLVLSACIAGLTAGGFGFEDALLLSIASFSNAGPAYQASVIDTNDFVAIGTLGDPDKLLLAFVMVVGRVEVIAILSLLSPSTWRR